MNFAGVYHIRYPGVHEGNPFGMTTPSTSRHHRYRYMNMISDDKDGSSSTSSVEQSEDTKNNTPRSPIESTLYRKPFHQIKRCSNDEYCGLSTEIYREISHRDLTVKANNKAEATEGASPKNDAMAPGSASTCNQRIVMNPASRDLFLDKNTSSSLSPLPDNKAFMNTKHTAQTPPTCMSSDEDSLYPSDSPIMMEIKKKKVFLPSLMGGGDASSPKPKAVYKKEVW